MEAFRERQELRRSPEYDGIGLQYSLSKGGATVDLPTSPDPHIRRRSKEREVVEVDHIPIQVRRERSRSRQRYYERLQQEELEKADSEKQNGDLLANGGPEDSGGAVRSASGKSEVEETKKKGKKSVASAPPPEEPPIKDPPKAPAAAPQVSPAVPASNGSAKAPAPLVAPALPKPQREPIKPVSMPKPAPPAKTGVSVTKKPHDPMRAERLLRSWLQRPPPMPLTHGRQAVPLPNLPKRMDFGILAGFPAQTFTTWNICSMSYILGVSWARIGDFPEEEELLDLDNDDLSETWKRWMSMRTEKELRDSFRGGFSAEEKRRFAAKKLVATPQGLLTLKEAIRRLEKMFLTTQKVWTKPEAEVQEDEAVVGDATEEEAAKKKAEEEEAARKAEEEAKKAAEEAKKAEEEAKKKAEEEKKTKSGEKKTKKAKDSEGKKTGVKKTKKVKAPAEQPEEPKEEPQEQPKVEEKVEEKAKDQEVQTEEPKEPEKVPVKAEFQHYFVRTVPVRVVDPNFTGWEQPVKLSEFGTSLIEYPLSETVIADYVEEGADKRGVAGLVRKILNTSYPEDVAPLVRILCMVLSVDSSYLRCDTTGLKFLRRSRKANDRVTIKVSPSKMAPSRATILILPQKLAIEAILGQLPELKYANSAEWVFVPVTLQFRKSTALIPYIISHMTSLFWAGTVSFEAAYLWDGPPGSNACYRGKVHQTPMANNVHIPGPSNVILVLMESIYDETIRIGRHRFPVGQIAQPHTWNPSDFLPVIRDYWSTGNVLDIASDCLEAFHEMTNNLSAGEAAGRALAIAAELAYGSYPGVYTSGHYDDLGGAWSFGGGPLAPDVPLCTSDFLSSEVKQELVISGFNFSVETPLHKSPTGVCQCIVEPDTGKFHWSSVPVGKASYNVTSGTPLIRLAAAANLCFSEPSPYDMKTPESTSTFLTNVAVGLSLATVNYLLKNDLDLRIWKGWARNAVGVYMNHMTNTMKVVTDGFSKWLPVCNLENKGTATIAQYYHMLPTEQQWSTFSAVPVHALQQWTLTMRDRALKPQLMVNSIINPYDELVAHGLELNTDFHEWKALALGTLDYLSYSPTAYGQEVGHAPSDVYLWLEQTSYVTTAAVDANRSYVNERSRFQSNVWAISSHQKLYNEAQRPNIIIKDSHLDADESDEHLRTNVLAYPDPENLEAFLQTLGQS